MNTWVAPIITTHLSTGQLRRRGWTDDDIQRLGEPDMERVEPYSGREVRLFAWERVRDGPPPREPEPRMTAGARPTQTMMRTMKWSAERIAAARERWSRPGEREKARAVALRNMGR
jgi:hypothetical protein